MLTKEECENVLSENKIYLKNQMLKKERISHSVYLLNTVTSLLERLIHEHFDNPPLKFEELKEGMWVWDNKYKYYFECNPRISTDMTECVWYESFWYNTGEGYDEFYEDYIEFEENRFYRKEVHG